MDAIAVNPVKKIQGTIVIPPDKSISHRAVILGSVAEGTTVVKNFLFAHDCMFTLEAFRKMGVNISRDDLTITIKGLGLDGLVKPEEAIYLGNSGTSIRLLSGLLAGQSFKSVLLGDESLSKRPMRRIIIPLNLMGAEIQGTTTSEKTADKKEYYPPLTLYGKKLKAIDYTSPVASAQVKSCILLAGLYAEGVTSVTEAYQSRDHTERMLKLFGVDVKEEYYEQGGEKISVRGRQKLMAPSGVISIPSDISSAAFFMIAASLLKNSDITIKNVGLNPTRTGVIDVLKNMNADVELLNVDNNWEPRGDIRVKSANLKGVTIEGDNLVRAIDELPIIMVAACFAKGITLIKGASELRVKETDRIFSMVTGLQKMGMDIYDKGTDIVISGRKKIKSANLDSFGDHRTAMSLIIAALKAENISIVSNVDCINTSFPGFMNVLKEVSL